MSCCGRSRAQFQIQKPHPTLSPTAMPGTVPAAPTQDAVAFLQYMGPSGLTAIGPVTGRRYRFDRPGARLAVDARDAKPLLAVQSLRQV